MHRNALCWCRSGVRWKSCHRDREQADPVHPMKALAGRHKPITTGACLHPSAPEGCSGYAIRSHTLQRGSALAAISEDGHVMSLGLPAAVRIMHNDGAILPQRTGVKLASTFPGFCSSHDTSLFLPIESGTVPISRESAFLLGYRTLAYELHAKQEGLVELAKIAGIADAGMPFDRQAEIQTELDASAAGMRLGEADLRRWKSDMDRRYARKDWARADMLAVEFDAILPFVAAFANQPEWDFAGKRLQHLFEKHPGQASLTVTVAGERTLALFTWFDGVNGVGGQLARSFEAIDADQRATALLRHCLAFCENLHLKPSWWDGLSDAETEDATALIKVGMPFNGGPPSRARLGRGPLGLATVGSTILPL